MSTDTEFTEAALSDLAERLIQQRTVDADAAVEYCHRFDQWVAQQLDTGVMDEATADARRSDIFFILGRLAYVDGRVDDAMALTQQSIDAATRSGRTERRILSLRAIARMYEYAGLQSDSTRLMFEALDLAEQLGDPRIKGLVMFGLASLYESQGAYEQTLDAAVKTYEYSVESGDQHLMWNAYAVVGLAYGYLGRNQEALEWLDRGLAEVDAAQSPQMELSLALYRMYVLGQDERLDEAIDVAEARLGQIEGLAAQHAAATLGDVAELYLERGDLDEAEDMLDRAERIASDEQLKGHLIRHTMIAADLYEAKGDASTALSMMRQHARLSEELRGKHARMRLVAVERHFAAELAEKTAEIHHLRTIELVDKNDQLAALNRQKDEILRVVAHDLRSPIAAVAMLSEMAMLDQADSTDTELVDQLRAMRTATSEMGDTIDKLLHLRGSEDARHGVALDVAAAKSIDWAAPLAADRSVTLEEHVAAVDLVVEEALVRRALDDVLWVVLHAVGPGDAVGIRARPTTSGGGAIVVTAPAVLEDAAKRTLYIGRRLVERMGGSLTIDAMPDERSIITIDLRASADVRVEPRSDQPSVTHP